MLADTIVTGEPLYSLTSTREVSGEFGRNRGHRRRAAQPAALLRRQRHDGHGRRRRHGPAARDLASCAAGPRCRSRSAALGLLHVPDHRRRRAVRDPALHDDPVAAADAVRRGRARGLDAGQRGTTARKVAVGVADALGARSSAGAASYYASDFSTLARQANFVESQHEQLNALIDDPEVAAALAGLPAGHGADARADPDPALRDRDAQGRHPGLDPAGARRPPRASSSSRASSTSSRARAARSPRRRG